MHTDRAIIKQQNNIFRSIGQNNRIHVENGQRLFGLDYIIEDGCEHKGMMRQRRCYPKAMETQIIINKLIVVIFLSSSNQ
jgi:hypothetical protein